MEAQNTPETTLNGKLRDIDKVTRDTIRDGIMYRVKEGMVYELAPGITGVMKPPTIAICRKFDKIRADMIRKQDESNERVAKTNTVSIADVAILDPESEDYYINNLFRMCNLVLSGLPDGWEGNEELTTHMLKQVRDDFLELK